MMIHTNKILIAVTSAGEFEKAGFRTGLWLSELTHFLDAIELAGYESDIASPDGGRVPIDPESLVIASAGSAAGMKGDLMMRYEDRRFMDRLSKTPKLSEMDPDAYDAIYMTGGHGVMFDFPQSEPLARLAARLYENDRIVSAVCHGPCGLLSAKLGNGHSLVKGKKVTGFSWDEEVLAKRDRAVPFSLEEELRNRGAKYSKSPIPFAAHVVEDDRLITGQNPLSARQVGEAVIKRLTGFKPATAGRHRAA